jgi:hypothetical protein
MEERKGAFRVLVGKTETRRKRGRPSRRWKNNITIDLHKLGWGYGLI